MNNIRVCIVVLGMALMSFGQSKTAILGTVTDASRAVIPGAVVTVTHEGTQTSLNTVTNAQGSFFMPVTLVGTYAVTVEHAGFQSETKTGILVQIDQNVRVDFSLNVGGVSERVIVEYAAPAIATDEASLGEIINQKSIQQLPLNGRDVFQLATLSAGIKMGYRNITSSPGGGEALLGAGVRENMNSISLDGVSIQNNLINTVTMRPSVDAVEEFKVQHGNYSAEYGMYIGVHVNLLTKAGTNDLHGSVFHFLRNEVLDARGFFEKPDSKKNPLRRNEFGFVLSGPIVVPKVYNGVNRSFFMVNYELLRFRQKGAALSTVFTPKMRAGDFSEFSAAVRDPLNNREPFPGNIIPNDRIPTQSKQLLEYLPLPNLPGLGANYLATTLNGSDADKVFLRLDHSFSTAAHVYVRYAHQNLTRHIVQTNPFGGKEEPVEDRNITVNYSHVVTPTVVNELRVGLQRARISTLNLFKGELALAGSRLGIPGLITGAENPGVPGVTVSGYNSIGDQGDATPLYQRDFTFQIYEGLSFSRGSHNFKAGFEARPIGTDRVSSNHQRGRISFDGSMTGNAAADFMIGLPRSTTTPLFPPFLDIRQTRYAAFFVDDWKVTPRFTLNLGVRYELSTSAYEKKGILTMLDPTYTFLVPETYPQVFRFSKGDRNNIAPRIGFAYRPFDNRTVIRGGFGIYYSANQLNNYTENVVNPPLARVRTFDSQASSPSIFLATAFSQPINAPQVPPNIVSSDWNLPSPYMQQWSLNVQRELRHNMGLEVGYLGSHTVKLDRNFWINTPQPGPGNIQLRRPKQQFGTIRLFTNDAFANYNAMQVVARQRFSGGASVLMSYTWSHAIDVCGDSNGGGGGCSPMAPFNLALERGNSSFDFRHRFMLSYVWEMPFFRNADQPALKHVLGGWQLSGITMIESGRPFSIVTSTDRANTGTGTRRADRVGDGNLDRDQRTVQRFFDTTAFANQAQYTFGNSGRNILTGPGTVNFDFSLSKYVSLGEDARLQFRFDAFNAFNTPSFGNPATTLGTSTFGQILGLKGNNRELQFGMRVSF